MQLGEIGSHSLMGSYSMTLAGECQVDPPKNKCLELVLVIEPDNVPHVVYRVTLGDKNWAYGRLSNAVRAYNKEDFGL